MLESPVSLQAWLAYAPTQATDFKSCSKRREPALHLKISGALAPRQQRRRRHKGREAVMITRPIDALRPPQVFMSLVF